MDSILFSNGFHGMGDGLHPFLRWIPYGMSSWSHNYTLILYYFQGGIHMDSIWNPYGMTSWNKNLTLKIIWIDIVQQFELLPTKINYYHYHHHHYHYHHHCLLFSSFPPSCLSFQEHIWYGKITLHAKTN